MTAGLLGLDRRGWPGTIVVAAIVALVAAGLPFLNGLVSADRPLAPGAVLQVGRAVRFTAAEGWSLDVEQTDPRRRSVVIHRGALSLRITTRESNSSLDEEFERLNEASTFTTAGGLTGIAGSYSAPASEGRFAVLRSGDTAVRVVARGLPDAMADGLDDVNAMVQSLQIGTP